MTVMSVEPRAVPMMDEVDANTQTCRLADDLMMRRNALLLL
jgi:hypothetical protein